MKRRQRENFQKRNHLSSFFAQEVLNCQGNHLDEAPEEKMKPLDRCSFHLLPHRVASSCFYHPHPILSRKKKKKMHHWLGPVPVQQKWIRMKIFDQM